MHNSATPSALASAAAETPLLPVPTRITAKATSRTLRMLAPADITSDPAFAFRHEARPDRAFTRVLSQALRTCGALDPILVWAEEEDGKPTGRYPLLDGAHRLAAIRSVRGPSGSRKPIPVVVLSGDRKAATLAALRANSRETLPLTMQERLDGAWRLVRDTRCAFTVSETAGASGVSSRTVDNMRKRWKAMQATGRQPTGEWWRDSKDTLPSAEETPEMTDAQREAQKIELANAVRKALGSWPRRDSDLVAEALRAALGNRELRDMAEWLYGAGDEAEDEFYTQPVVAYTGTDQGPQGDF